MRHFSALLIIFLGLCSFSASGTETAPLKTQSDDTEFSETPYTEYGSFNEEEEEEADARFFQYGRFFGVGLGIGMQGATGNRGLLYEGGFPLFELKLHYWFDFNFALQLAYSSVQHQYNAPDRGGVYDVTLSRLGADMKYYFDTTDLSAAISFANPNIVAGVGRYGKIDFNEARDIRDTDSSVGFNLGVGFEFTLKPKKSYVYLESKVHTVRFRDTLSSDFEGLNDLKGYFYTFTAGFLFTW